MRGEEGGLLYNLMPHATERWVGIMQCTSTVRTGLLYLNLIMPVYRVYKRFNANLFVNSEKYCSLQRVNDFFLSALPDFLFTYLLPVYSDFPLFKKKKKLSLDKGE